MLEACGNKLPTGGGTTGLQDSKSVLVERSVQIAQWFHSVSTANMPYLNASSWTRQISCRRAEHKALIPVGARCVAKSSKLSRQYLLGSNTLTYTTNNRIVPSATGTQLGSSRGRKRPQALSTPISFPAGFEVLALQDYLEAASCTYPFQRKGKLIP